MTATVNTVGVIGAGRMGLPIVGHLVRAGFRALVYEINAARRAEVERRQAVWADMKTLAAKSDAILVCVGYDREVVGLIEGELLESARPGCIIAILSTINPGTVRRLAQVAGQRGVNLVDATVCRGGRAADEGTLLSFVGGPAEVVERLTPVIRAYSSDVVHSGEAGSAEVWKAANNLILWACMVANHEALALAQRFGVDVETLRGALLISSATNGSLESWGKQTMAWADDDLAIIAEMAQECGISLPQTGVVREVCRTLRPRLHQLDKYGR